MEKDNLIDDINLKTIFKSVLVRPADNLDTIIYRENYRYVYLFPLLYGIITGISKTVSQLSTADPISLIPASIGPILSTTILSFILSFIYSWIVVFISNSLKGIASAKMTFAIVSYSLIPLILGAFLILIIKIALISTHINGDTLLLTNMFLFYYVQIAFFLWTLYVLVLGNAIINEFSIFKSILSSAGLAIFIVLYAIFSKYK